MNKRVGIYTQHEGARNVVEIIPLAKVRFKESACHPSWTLQASYGKKRAIDARTSSSVKAGNFLNLAVHNRTNNGTMMANQCR